MFQLPSTETQRRAVFGRRVTEKEGRGVQKKLERNVKNGDFWDEET